ncbi:MAG: tetratricopeptide repeat protein, partial [Candidatus Acidiferrales bacterium]
ICLSRALPCCLLALSMAAAASSGRGDFARREPPGRPVSHSIAAEHPVTFDRDIAPIIFRDCANCHHAGEASPFTLLTYGDVKSHARQIAAVTRKRLMPPWLPEDGELKFADELRLTDRQISLFQEWVDDGEKEGDAADLPPLPHFVEGWQLGKPDLILTADKPYLLPAGGDDNYWNFIFRAPVDRVRWLKAMEIRPGDKKLIHHANVLVDRTQSARHMEKEPGAGFGGMELEIESESFDPDSHFLFWKPGTVPYVEPDGMALRLDKNTDLVLNTHMQPSGKAEKVQPTIGLYFTDVPASIFPMLLQLENDRALDIPPGAKDFVVTDDFTLPVDVDLLAIYPHAHYLGKDLLGYATLPDGSTKTLIHIPRWDLNWQAVFRYVAPVRLPKGTIVEMKYTYDNSEDNIANPNHPPQRVMAGNRARDEMAHLWLQVIPQKAAESDADPRKTLLEAFARHRVDKNSADFEAHYNLGAMLQARGELDEAIKEYSRALELHPNDATANNSLGGALLAAGRSGEAIERFHLALKNRPDYFDAHYNLGNALIASNDFPGAIEQFRAAVRLRPDDADAEANLGGALAETGQYAEAKTHLERALQIDPKHTLARDNLEQLKKLMPAQ